MYVGTKNRTITKCFKQNLHKFCGSKGLKNCHYPNEETMQIGSWPATQHTSKSFKIPTWLQTFIEASETHKWTVLSKSVSYVSLTSAHPRQKTIYCRLLAFAPPTQICMSKSNHQVYCPLLKVPLQQSSWPWNRFRMTSSATPGDMQATIQMDLECMHCSCNLQPKPGEKQRN